MTIYSKVFLSGSTNGRGIAITQLVTPGTLIHTAALAGTTDVLWLWAATTNIAADRLITLEFGGVGASDQWKTDRAARALQPGVLIERMILTAGLEVRAFVDVADVNIWGYVNRIGP